MVFSSLNFVLIFMPVFFTCYYIVPDKWKNAVLLIGSLSFYLVGTLKTPYHFALFVLSIIVDFEVGVGIEKYQKHKKAILVSGILFHLIALSAFKYSGFVFSQLAPFIPKLSGIPSLGLPIGISFYTFQGISYIADVYRGKTKAEKSVLRYAVYIAMFEQLIAGPIVTYPRVKCSLKSRKINTSAVLCGLGMFVFGLGLKVLLANPIGKLWSQTLAIGFESVSTPLAWMALFAYSFQIYFDFFGYSLMAVGLGKMLGFKLPKNFDHPYMSLTVTEFWRRWHITLGSWFREYVYIPLGGNRCSKARNLFNLLFVWLLTGIWHGAGYNFLLWGFILFLLIATEKYLTGKFLNSHPAIGHIYMLLIIPLTWAVFAVSDMRELGILFTRLFPFFGTGALSVFKYDFLKYLKEYYPFFVASILFSTRLPYKLLERIRNSVLVPILLLAIFSASIYCMYKGFDDPFLYFRF